MLAELRQEVVLDHAGGDDVLEDEDVAAGDFGVADEIDLEGGGGVGVGDVADDVDVAVRDVTRDGAQKIAEETARAFEDAEEKDFAGTGVLTDFFAQAGDPFCDLFGAVRSFDLRLLRLTHRHAPTTLRTARPRGPSP